jgi:3-methyladenine DNA glycosylase/8-oxoguanine DNA glycosylase
MTDRLHEDALIAFDIAEKWRPFRSLATSYLFASAFDSNTTKA